MPDKKKPADLICPWCCSTFERDVTAKKCPFCGNAITIEEIPNWTVVRKATLDQENPHE